MYVIISESKHASQVSEEIIVKYNMQLLVMVVVVVIVVVVQGGGRGWGDGGGGGDIMRQSALCSILSKIYPSIAENDL